MANVDATVLLDFVSSLAVLGLLVVSFSALAPGLKSGWYAPPLLGVFFGLVVGLQMSMPLSPTDGVIIDMRNVPIALAGAFLGLRGLLVCLAIAIGMRLGIGGLGTAAGVIGMLIAGAVGCIWSVTRDRLPSGDGARLLLLGLGVNLHMLSAFAVPADIMHWYFSEAAPTIFLLNSLCIPAFGWMLLREQNHIQRQARLAEAAQLDPVTRLLTPRAFARELSHFTASDNGNDVAGIAAITIKNAGWMKTTWGTDCVDQALGALRIRLNRLFQDQRPLGVDSRNRILVPLTAHEMQDLRPLRKTLRRLASDTPMTLDGGIDVPVSVLVESFKVHQPNRVEQTLADIHRSMPRRRQPHEGKRSLDARNPGPGGDATIPQGMCRKTFRRLFDETDAKMRQAARQG